MTTGLIDQLSTHVTLGSVPRHELEWLVAHGSVIAYPEGTSLSHRGKPVTHMYVVLTGHAAIFVDRGAGPKKVLEWRGGDVAGVLPYSRVGAAPGDSVALEPTTVLAIPREDLPEMTRHCYEITSILVHTMIDRARQFRSSDLHDEKMISLGNLSARLAHELNNPSAAIERSAALLEDRLDDSERAALDVGCARLTDEQFSAIHAIRDACLAKPQRGVLSPLQQAEREDAIADWLDDRGIDSRVAALLSETSVSVDSLEEVARVVGSSSLSSVLRWVAAGCSVRSLASDIQDAAVRISGLVSAVKGFTHMDQARSAEVDLATSLDNTVTVFRSKARERKVAISVHIEEHLPRVCGYVGELNQIFANLLDNALDAVPESGQVEITALRERNRVVVRVIDNGPGIPKHIQEQMFEPFFTTKPVGKGTGLGLDIVRRLLGHNDGTIEVDSSPGRTEFSVRFPVASAAAGGAA
jgi:signal transduction histidine kinase